jgi:hypothetical protein
MKKNSSINVTIAIYIWIQNVNKPKYKINFVQRIYNIFKLLQQYQTLRCVIFYNIFYSNLIEYENQSLRNHNCNKLKNF